MLMQNQNNIVESQNIEWKRELYYKLFTDIIDYWTGKRLDVQCSNNKNGLLRKKVLDQIGGHQIG